jgi:hypothetical protein
MSDIVDNLILATYGQPLIKKDEPCYTCLVYPMCTSRYFTLLNEYRIATKNKTNESGRIVKEICKNCGQFIEHLTIQKNKLKDVRDKDGELMKFAGFFICNPFKKDGHFIFYSMSLK